jgi:hypothetical protein
MEEIIVDIKPDGTIEAKGKGIKGKTCQDAMKFIEKLGLVTEQRKTSEYYQKAPQQNRLRTGRKR